MSLIVGETPKQQARDSALKAESSTGELAASLPLSITLWVYFDHPPGASETHTLLWYGDKDSQANHVLIEATANGTTGVDVTATLRGSTGSVSAAAQHIPAGEWIMLTVTVAEEGDASHRVTLFLNDSEADTAATSVGTTSPGAYDRFVLGATSGGSNFGHFRAEHIAIWEPVERLGADEPLSIGEIEELFEKRWAPITPPEIYSIDRNPGIAYWMLVGHWAAGIEADNGQDGENVGLLFNQANPPLQTAKPSLQMLDAAKPVVWSAKTPVMRYLVSQDIAPGPLIHPPIPAVSRLQPHFYVFNTTGPLGTFKYGPLEIPVYTHPNFIPKGIASSESAQSLWPLVALRTDYLPGSDVALIARRVADFIEFTGLTRGTGTVGDGLYEGWVFVRAIGLGDVVGPDQDQLRGYRGTLVTTDPFAPFTGTNNAVPLNIHPLDSVQHDEDRPNRPWHTWFNAHGHHALRRHGLKSFIVEIAMIVPTGSSADPAASAGVLWRVI